jgi:hypothetical protein
MNDSEKSFVVRIWGRTCRELRTQQYCYAERLEAEWNVFWMRDDSAWIKFFFDAGVFFWKEEAPSVPEGSRLHQYKLVEPTFASTLSNKEIVAANFGPLPGGGRVLGIWFEGGVALRVENQSDRTSIVFG